MSKTDKVIQFTRDDGRRVYQAHVTLVIDATLSVLAASDKEAIDRLRATDIHEYLSFDHDSLGTDGERLIIKDVHIYNDADSYDMIELSTTEYPPNTHPDFIDILKEVIVPWTATSTCLTATPSLVKSVHAFAASACAAFSMLVTTRSKLTVISSLSSFMSFSTLIDAPITIRRTSMRRPSIPFAAIGRRRKEGHSMAKKPVQLPDGDLSDAAKYNQPSETDFNTEGKTKEQTLETDDAETVKDDDKDD